MDLGSLVPGNTPVMGTYGLSGPAVLLLKDPCCLVLHYCSSICWAQGT